ncbi:MAG: DNA recombination protein RmuC [Parcubacteria group bacterium]|nr:DNA recombination protein RmuC [Parcubacteria group bacterium]
MVFYALIGFGFLMLGLFLHRIYKKIGSVKEPDQNFLLLNQRLDALSSSTNQALRDTLQLVTSHLKENSETTQRSVSAVNQQVQGFTQGITTLSENVKQVQTSVKDVASFQNIFKSPKLRGIWGESSLEASLGQYFSKEMYSLQHYFKSGEAVDAILRLPNNLLLPIDSKFNWENFEKMVNADTDIARDVAKKDFYSDVKKKIDEIASKYILPSESTTNFAMMYVPAETVYYEIINNIKDVDIPKYARSKRVFLVSPNTFALSVSAIQHWFRDVQITKQTQEILKKLSRVSIDGHKLADGFRKLGKHLSDAQGSYGDSEKRLDLMMDRVENLMEAEDTSDKSEVLVE